MRIEEGEGVDRGLSSGLLIPQSKCLICFPSKGRHVYTEPLLFEERFALLLSYYIRKVRVSERRLVGPDNVFLMRHNPCKLMTSQKTAYLHQSIRITYM